MRHYFPRALGNPFLTLKLLREGSVQYDFIPQAIIQWSIARLAMTEPEQKSWVKLLAYCPTPVDRELQERLANKCSFRREILPGWNGFLTSSADGAIVFRHEIVREALVAGLCDIDREDGEARLLEVLCADDEFAQSRGELAVCVAQAANAADKVVKYTPYAVCQAEARGAYTEAAQYLQRALPFAKRIGPEAYTEIVELLVCRTSVSEPITEAMLSEIAQANALWRRHDKPGPLARNHLLLCRLYRYKADREIAQKHLRIAIDLFEDQDDQKGGLALALAIQARMHLEERRNDKAFAVALEAARKARAGYDRASRIDAWVTLAVVLHRRQKRRAEVMMAVCSILADRWNLHELRARICATNCDEALAAMNLPGAERCVAEWGAVRQTAPECWKAALDGREALVLVLCGKLDEGETLASRVLNGNRTTASMRFSATLALALGRSHREAADAAASLVEAELLAKAIGDPRNVTLARLGLIEHAFLEGRVGDALAFCRTDGAEDSDRNLLDTDLLMRQWRIRLLTIMHGKLDDAYDAAGLTTGFNGNPVEVAAELAQLGYAFKAALAKLFVEGPESSRLFGEAVAEFSAIGAKAGLSCTYRMAEARGIALKRIKRERGPYRAARAHPLGLTRREVEILRMIVDGASNRDIADKVGRSLRTVEHHVSAILGKMSLENRIQAVLFALANPAVLEPSEEFA